jgi:hypothetical protein
VKAAVGQTTPLLAGKGPDAGQVVLLQLHFPPFRVPG